LLYVTKAKHPAPFFDLAQFDFLSNSCQQKMQEAEMRKCTVLVATLLAAAIMLASSNSPEAADEAPYLLQDDGEVRVLRGLEAEKDFDSATLPQAVEQPPADASEPQAEPQSAAAQVDENAFEKAEGRWESQWETSHSGTTTAKTTFDIYGRMASIPGPMVTFYAADENGTWEGYWVEESGRQRCTTKNDGGYHWGVVQFQFNSAYNEFEGAWDFCGEGKKWPWKGKRVGG
jgi:hypothetical protein